MVGSGFLDIYPGQAYPPHLQSLVSGYATNQGLSRAVCVSANCQCAETNGPVLACRPWVTRKRKPHRQPDDYFQLTSLLPRRRLA